MAIELVASRILSPYLGSSNLIWTCIIGMMLAFMSLGYYIGGKICDKKPSNELLSTFITISAISISFIPLSEVFIIEPLSQTGLNLILISIICSTVSFAIPSMLLSFASPFAVKLSECNNNGIGKVSGKISAISTIGSIVGTFCTGFLLIPYIGVKNIILMLSIILIIISIINNDNKTIKNILSSLIILLFCILLNLYGRYQFKTNHPEIILDTDSEYSRIWIKQFNANDGIQYKSLEVSKGMESVSADVNVLTAEYLKFYDLFNVYQSKTNNVLIIGGAAYTYPTYFLNKYKDKQIDVVEIDPKMTKLAEDFFNLDQTNPNLKIIHDDGRHFLNTTDSKYDCILLDAFKGLNVPFQLTTREALENAKKCLNENGIIITNIVASTEGPDSRILKNEYITYKNVFSNVKVFKVNTNKDISPTVLQNFIIIGFKNFPEYIDKDITEYEYLTEREIEYNPIDSRLETDDLCSIGV